MKLKIGINFLIICLFCSCASMFIPKKQRINIETQNENSVVLLDGTEIGRGSTISKRVGKYGSRQLAVQTEGYYGSWHALVPNHRPVLFWVLQPFNVFSFYIGYIVDFTVDKNVSYPNKRIIADEPIPLQFRNQDKEKYIEIVDLVTAKTESNTQFITVHLPYSKDPVIRERLKGRYEARTLRDLGRRKVYKTVMSQNNYGPFYVNKNESKHLENLNNLLNITGYTDTFNNFNLNPVNHLLIDCRIESGTMFSFQGKAGNTCAQAKLESSWFIRSPYGEIIDSFSLTSSSGLYVFANLSSVQDALCRAFIELQKDPLFQRHLLLSDSANNGTVVGILKLKKGQFVTNPDQAMGASVLIESEGGHGSGFAISEDGYLLTNFHVIATNRWNKFGKITVTDQKGIKYDAHVERFDRAKDFALLKIDRKFDYCFQVSDTVEYKLFQKIFTIGSPMTSWMTHSASDGIVSGQRRHEGKELIQLKMSVSPGNSGGPVFGESGQLIGIIVSRINSEELKEFCFAIPAIEIGPSLKISY